MTEYERYDEVYDDVMKTIVQDTFKPAYRKGWIVSQIMRMPSGKWLIKWDKNLLEDKPDDQN